MIRANMAEPMWRQVPRALGWTLNYLFTGTLFRVYRASHQYGLALTTFQMMLVWWLVLSGLGGWLIGWLAMRFAGAPLALGVVAGVAAALVCFRLLRPLADQLFVVQINSHWPYLLEYARGEPSCWDRCIEAGARRLVEIARPTTPTRSSWSATAAAASPRRRWWRARWSSIRISAATARASCC